MTVDVRDAYWTVRSVRAMGSDAHLVVGDAPAGVVDWAIAELERLEQCWSRFRSDSDLSRFNGSHGEWIAAGGSLLLALTCARELYRATGGAFDPTILDALQRVGYDRSFELVERSDASHAVSACVRAPGFELVEVDVDRSLARVAPGVHVDLGGIGKGLAADLLARGLVDRGARTALVSLGGDLCARGDAPDGAWNIPVEDPLDPARVALTFPLGQGALVTSTTRIRVWRRNGTVFHHLIDPRTGDSARTGIAAVVAHAPEAWWAEGIAKAIVVSGREAGAHLARTTGVRAWIFEDDGTVYEVGQ